VLILDTDPEMLITLQQVLEYANVDTTMKAEGATATASVRADCLSRK
jgi:hypothetical protein